MFQAIESDPLKEDKPIKGKIQIPLNSKICAITMDYLYNIEGDDEIYVHLEGFKNSF